MPTILENLETALANAVTEMAELSAKKKASYSVDGQGVQWDSHIERLERQIEFLNKQIQIYGGGFELRTQIRP
jgi:hypothetical protein